MTNGNAMQVFEIEMSFVESFLPDEQTVAYFSFDMLLSSPFIQIGNVENEATLQVALSLLTLHIMGKLVAGDAGSLSVSLVEKIRLVFKKVIPFFYMFWLFSPINENLCLKLYLFHHVNVSSEESLRD